MEFPAWQTVYWCFRRLMRRLLFQTNHDVVLMLDRELEDRQPCPRAGVVDSHSVKAPAAKELGYDAREEDRRAQAAYSRGYEWAAADGKPDASGHRGQDWSRGGSAGFEETLAGAEWRLRSSALMDKSATLDFVVAAVRRHEDQVGFAVPPRRWVVERTFGWMIRWRRLVRDYKRRPEVAETMIYVAMGGRPLARVAHP